MKRLKTLSEIGKEHDTDKGDALHSFNGLSYLDIYEKYFSPMRHKKLSLLEIGVQGGCSLRMWKKFFPLGNICGLDIHPESKQFEEDRITIETGSQIDRAVIEKICGQVDEFDIIVDDGSHVNKHTIQSFNLLFEHLASGGFYVIEDLALSYMDLTPHVGSWHGMKLNKDLDPVNKRGDMNTFFFDLIKQLDHLGGDVLSVQFWAMMCFIQKTRAAA